MLSYTKLFNFNVLVLVEIIIQHGVLGVSFDYANPKDFSSRFVNYMDDVTENGLEATTAVYNPADNSGHCPFGLRFKKDCGWCNCVPETGITMCTLIGCGRCNYGKNFTIDCNTCRCDEATGITRCTRNKCNEGTFSNCVHGRVFTKDCNTCHCSLQTGHTTCTTKDCPIGKDSTHKLCPKGRHYSPDRCNYCSCDPNTGATFCTLAACVSVKGEKLSNKQSSKNKNLNLKIKEAATDCKPPEVIVVGSCRCDCRLPGVVVCREACFKGN